ncbi:MAG: DEAD/DEAH box helicase family protein [Planctomycetota bacterium]|nr:DEAD/DEAH box helicase family protein [Planctomycetota bacterium]
MELRTYQREAVDAVYRHLRERDDNPCVVIPTGGGKTPVMATICRDAVSLWGGRVLVLAHVKELLEQTAGTLARMAPDLPMGIYSAGLGRRDLGYAVTVAGIQSVWRRACDLDAFDLVIIDEAHMIPPEGDGMYRQFLSDAKAVNPRVRTIGLTATPYRMSSGTICKADHFLNAVCYEIGVRELIVQGYLCRLRTKAGSEKADWSELHVRGGEYIAGEVEAMMDTDRLVRSACAEIVEHTKGRKACLVFASGIQHGLHIQRVLEGDHGVRCGFVCGDTPTAQRDETIREFCEGRLPYLANVNVLTTGFDAPNVDCVAMLRPTLSPGLYYQMVGRGFRTYLGKNDCLVLDFGGNVLRHGPVDAIKVTEPGSGDGEAPAKECPDCHAVIAAGYAVCPECGHEFPDRMVRQHEAKASDAAILSSQVTTTEYPVREIHYGVHTKRDAPPDAPKTMRVEYRIGWSIWRSEWVCFEHTGWVRAKAESWWRRRTDRPAPATAAEAVDLASGGDLAEPVAITVRSVAGEKYDQIVGYRFADEPPPDAAFAPDTSAAAPVDDFDLDDAAVPF